MNLHYPNLFSPFTIKKTRFRNRILMAPFTPTNGDVDGLPSADVMAYFERRARGGAAQLTLGETPVDLDRANRKYGGCYLDLTRDKYTAWELCKLTELTNMMHQHQTIAAIELCHIGLWNNPETIAGHKNPVGPVSFMRPDGVQVEGLTIEMMDEIADNFARSAQRAKELGFDTIIIHGAHGWLQSQFLSPIFNTRTDEYGGCLENRARFPIEIVNRVRAAVGEDTIIEYRISGEERVEGGVTLEETIQFLKMIEDKIDLIHVSVGCYQNPVRTRTFPSIYEKYGCNADLAAAVKRAVSKPVAVVGAINTPEVAEEIIATGKADFVCMVKQLIADPDFPLKAAEGKGKTIVPCIRCYRCMGGSTPNPICSVNPLFGREIREPYLGTQFSHQQVLIAGGGVGGMVAAITAAQQGHDVLLCEREGELGGTLLYTRNDPTKHDLYRYLCFLIRSVEAEPSIRVRLNCTVTDEFLSELMPDVVIVAIGATPARPALPGIEKTITSVEAYSNVRIGDRIVIIGGGLAGCELACHLYDLGKEVTVLEMGPTFAADAEAFPRMALEDRLARGVRILCNTRALAISVGQVKTNVGTFTADTIICAVGTVARKEEANILASAVSRSFIVGDCRAARCIAEAVHEGYFAARDI